MFKDMKSDSAAQFDKMSGAFTQMRYEGQFRLDKMDERFTILEARMGKIEKQSSEKKEKGMDTTGKIDGSQGVLDKNEAVATGCKGDSTEKEVMLLLEKCIDTAGMKKEHLRIKCPANPITHAFIEFEDSDERDQFIRSAKMQQMKLKERKIKISPAMDAAERFHHTRMGFIKLCLHTKQQIPLTKITLNHKKRNVIVDGQIVVKTCEDGTLKYNHHHNIEKYVEQLLEE